MADARAKGKKRPGFVGEVSDVRFAEHALGVGAQYVRQYQIVSDAEIAKLFGKPSRIERSAAEGAFAGFGLKTYRYPNFHIETVANRTDKDTFWILRMVTSNSQHNVAGKLSPGDSETKLLQAYPKLTKRAGKNPGESNYRFVFNPGLPEWDFIEFTLVRGVVTDIDLNGVLD